jgi:glycogen synthase
MSGRLDPVQKGYYVFLRAIERFSIDEIKVILTPLPSRREDMDYFYEVACKCRGNVTVFPMRMSEGYNEFQTGATFGVMPSIYEPFGAAVEYMANGTVVIARATGGLVNQVDESCGFLFFEDSSSRTTENIKSYIDASDIVQLRKKNPWAEAMAESLYRTMKRAIGVYKNRPEKYYQLIINGFKRAGRFTWNESARKYFEVYNMITQ